MLDVLLAAERFADNFIEGILPLMLCDTLLFLPIIRYLRRGKRYSARELFVASLKAAGVLLTCLLIVEPEVSARAAFVFPIVFALIVRRRNVHG